MADFTKVYKIKFDTRSAQNKTDKLQKSLQKVGISAKRANKGLDKLSQDGKRGLDSVKKASVRAEKGINRIRKASMRAGAGLRKFSRNWNRFVVLPIAASGLAALKFSRDFNKGMANVATLIPGETKKVQDYKKALMGLSAVSGKSLEDLTGGLYETISAFGDDAGDAVERLNIATEASVAGLATTKDSLALLSAVTKGYGDTSTDAMKKASDLAFMTVKLGQTTFPELAASMGRVIPLAAQFEEEQRVLFGTMATLTGVTGNAAEVSTQLRSVYGAALKPTQALTAVAKKYGFESAAAMLKTKKLTGFMEILRKETDGNEAALGKLVSRKEAQVAVLALLGGQADTWTEKLEKMKTVVGATTEAYKEQTEGVNKAGHSFEQTKRRMMNLAIRIGDRLLPVVSKLLDRIEPLIKHFEDMDKEAVDFYITLGKWAVILGVGSKLMGGMLSFTGMIAGMGGAGGTMAAANAGMLGMIGKAGMLAATFAAAYAAGSALMELFIEPHEKKRADLKDRAQYSAKDADRLAATGTLEQQKAGLAQVRSDKEKLLHGQKGASEILGSIFSPVETGRKRGEQELSLRQAEITLQTSISKKERSQAERAELLAGGGTLTRGGGMQVQAPVNVVINAPGGEPTKIKRELEKGLSRHLSNLAPASQ